MESATCCGMESAQGAGWNHGNAVYGIKPQELYSIRASRNAMRDFVGVPYNARGALIPYQACGLDKQKKELLVNKSSFLLVEHRGFEPLTPTLPVLCAPNCANAPMNENIIPNIFTLVNSFPENCEESL